VEKPKVVFMGTPDFAVPSLEKLIEAGFKVPLVITQPDKPAGRGKKLKAPPVKLKAQEHGIPVCQPEKLKDNRQLQELLKEIEPDLVVVAAYGKILPDWLLKLPKRGTVNVHASLLPKYRGASPIQAALLNGEKETGVTLMEVVPELDAGPIIAQRKVKIEPTDNAQTLHDKLSRLGAQLLVETLPDYLNGRVTPAPQNEEEATYCPKITKEMGRIDWNLKAEEIFNRVRAFTPWPSAYCFYRGKRIKLTEVEPVEFEGSAAPGTVVSVKGGLTVAAGEGAVKVLRLKPEGRKEISGEEFVRGYRVEKGEQLS